MSYRQLEYSGKAKYLKLTASQPNQLINSQTADLIVVLHFITEEDDCLQCSVSKHI